jgi:hypothetical protein
MGSQEKAVMAKGRELAEIAGEKFMVRSLAIAAP